MVVHRNHDPITTSVRMFPKCFARKLLEKLGEIWIWLRSQSAREQIVLERPAAMFRFGPKAELAGEVERAGT